MVKCLPALHKTQDSSPEWQRGKGRRGRGLGRREGEGARQKESKEIQRGERGGSPLSGLSDGSVKDRHSCPLSQQEDCSLPGLARS